MRGRGMEGWTVPGDTSLGVALGYSITAMKNQIFLFMEAIKSSVASGGKNSSYIVHHCCSGNKINLKAVKTTTDKNFEVDFIVYNVFKFVT